MVRLTVFSSGVYSARILFWNAGTALMRLTSLDTLVTTPGRLVLTERFQLAVDPSGRVILM